MNVLVTGSASPLARVLLPVLVNDDRVKRVIGVDIRTGGFTHPKYRFRAVDTRGPELAVSLGEVDAVIHLGFAAAGRRFGPFKLTRETMRDINVHGTQNVFELAAQQGVKHAILLSSAAVYKLDHFHRGSLTENHPRGTLPGFAHAEDRSSVEDWLDGFEAQHPALRVVRLRPHLIVGPQAEPYVLDTLDTGLAPRFPDPQPLAQCVHENDVVNAILTALFSDARGAYNLAASNAMAVRDMQQLLHGRVRLLPLTLLRNVLTARWRLSGKGLAPAWVEGLRYNFAVHSGRARRELGWKPRYDTVQDCLKTIANPVPDGKDN
ncbi:MAG: NAD-dependent epimerase/dehydratase family protein [Gammaproteobacteria bacterium]|nr:MAG: NAD-dependent epimerase/dehydratase family protein [Gammaproteobacteria bacterium]